MKKNKIVYLFALAFTIVSCTTTTSMNEKDGSQSAEKNEISSSNIIEKESNKKNQNVDIIIQNQPQQTISGNSFKSSYDLLVVDDDNLPIENLSITASYPSSNKNGIISFKTETLITDENGKISFLPPKTSFAVKSTITFYPTPSNTKADSVKSAMNNSVSASWNVRSNIINKGAVLFIWNYSENNKPTNNSYEILSQLRKDGVSMVGNAPVNETSYINSDSKTLFKQNYEIIENTFGYLIAGTVKFVKPVEKVDTAYSCTLVADLKCIDMNNGNELLSFSVTNTSTGINWNDCVTKCRNELAVKVCDEIIYNL